MLNSKIDHKCWRQRFASPTAHFASTGVCARAISYCFIFSVILCCVVESVKPSPNPVNQGIACLPESTSSVCGCFGKRGREPCYPLSCVEPYTARDLQNRPKAPVKPASRLHLWSWEPFASTISCARAVSFSHCFIFSLLSCCQIHHIVLQRNFKSLQVIRALSKSCVCCCFGCTKRTTVHHFFC